MAEQVPKSGGSSGQQAEKDRQRSPAYPSIPLDEAIEKVRTVYNADRGSASPMEAVASHWGMSPKSSGFLQAVASIVRYGLMDELDGKPRRLKPSKDALDILLLPDTDPKHQAAVRRAALTPGLFKTLWEAYGVNTPSDHTLLHDLVTVRHFRAPTAADAIKQYKKTISFAKLGNCDNIENGNGQAAVEVGDLVQWESQGALQFPEPRKVTGVSDDGNWLFVDGSLTGIPREQAKKVQAPAGQAVMNPPIQQPPAAPPIGAPPINPNFKPAPASAKQDVFTTDAGEVVVRWPDVLSAEEFSDIEGWLDMLKRKIKRSIKDAGDNKQN